VNEAREQILRRLRDNQVASDSHARHPAPRKQWSLEQRIQRFSEQQQRVHGEVHRLARSQWLDWLAVELPRRGLRRILAGTGDIGAQLAAGDIRGIELRRYDQEIETWKPELFGEVDAAITGTRCGIAETGSLVLWPEAAEPRLMSLVPPVHIALLEAEKLHETFAQVIEAENWSAGMPTNALLISGPSKTADIEQTLAYGIHGPRELITLILE
jgi:L-lactate dehydrogenase complex protein LldG